MTQAIIVVLVAVFVALRLWRRSRGGLRRRTSGSPSAEHGESARPPGRQRRRLAGRRPRTSTPRLGDAGLVAAREIRERVRGRVFRAGTALILVVVGAAIVVPVVRKKTSHVERVGVVGALSGSQRTAVLAAGGSVGVTVRLVDEPQVAQARADLAAGRINLAVLDARSVLVNRAVSATDPSTTALLARTIAARLGVEQAFADAGLSTAQASVVSSARPLPVTSLHPAAKEAARTTSVVGLVLVFLMLTQYTTWTLIGVMEEKSSRVVEVLLAAVRPVELLAGKVLGIGLVALGQAALIVAFAVGLGAAVGSDVLRGTAPVVLVATATWLVLGYAFYCWVYAAAGSMAERQDQVQTLVIPLSVPMIIAYILAISTASSGNPSTFFRVLAYLPPTAPFAMPVLVGLGRVTVLEFGASAVLSVACTVGVARLAAAVYRRAILRTGARVRLRQIVAEFGT